MQSGYQTELHLFGRDEDNQIPLMNTLISELKLSDKVKIFKYTNQPLQEFKILKPLYLQVNMRIWLNTYGKYRNGVSSPIL